MQNNHHDSAVNLVLASASPRRQQLLTELTFAKADFKFATVIPNIDESYQGETPYQFVSRLAQEKAQAGFALYLGDGVNSAYVPVLGADTIVVLGDKILGKPKDKLDAMQTLMQLSGKTHCVMTAVALYYKEKMTTHVVSTQVTFCDLNQADIQHYIDTGEPLDKAGSYGIQALGGSFVRAIEGSYSAVVGLPMVETRELLTQFNIL